MPVIDELLYRVKRFYEAKRRPDVHYECRRCGETLSRKTVACPACGSSEIATILL